MDISFLLLTEPFLLLALTEIFSFLLLGEVLGFFPRGEFAETALFGVTSYGIARLAIFSLLSGLSEH